LSFFTILALKSRHQLDAAQRHTYLNVYGKGSCKFVKGSFGWI